MVQEFVLREGTEYGVEDIPLDVKVCLLYTSDAADE